MPMSELAVLEKRRQLVELSADLQRATISRRLASLEKSRPLSAVGALGALASLGARPGVRKLAFTGALMAWRAWRRRRKTH